MRLDEYARRDGLGLADLLRAGEVAPRELAELAIAAIEALNPHLNAVIEIYRDAVPERERRDFPEPFRGVPTLNKDYPFLRGRLAEMGSELARGNRAAQDSPFALRLVAGGVLPIGRTTTSELALAATTEGRLTGRTANPWDPLRGVAGSSGGAAAAVASGMVPFAHGTDGGGSIRNPAAFCGLVGLKPSRGRVSGAPGATAPLLGLSARFMLTRSVRDCAVFLDLLHGPEPGESYEIPPPDRPYLEAAASAPQNLRIALCTSSWSGTPIEEDVLQATLAAGCRIEAMGHVVEPSSPEFDYELFLEAQKVIWCAYEAHDCIGLARKLGREIGPDNLQATSLAVIEAGQRLSADRLVWALAQYDLLTRRIGAYMQGFDVLVTPTACIRPEPLGTFDPDEPGADLDRFFEQLAPKETFTALFNATGMPALSLPLGWSADGLPIGVQLVARFGREDLLLGLAGALEQEYRWSDRVPPLHASRLSAGEITEGT
jgi:amidase